MPALIINSSSSEEEESDSTGTSSSGEEVEVMDPPGPRTYRPPASLAAKELNPWYDPELEKLLDEAFPMTDEEKREAGSMMCPTMLLQSLSSASAGVPIVPKPISSTECPYGFTDKPEKPTTSTEGECPYGFTAKPEPTPPAFDMTKMHSEISKMTPEQLQDAKKHCPHFSKT